MRIFIVYQEHHYCYGHFKQSVDKVFDSRKKAKAYCDKKNDNPNSNYRYVRSKELM